MNLETYLETNNFEKNDELYDHSIDTIDPDEPTDLPGPITDEEVDWLESKVELSLGI